MLLNNLFPNVGSDTIKNTFDKYNIQVPDKYSFSNVNLVIGPNGSGKTRFLRAIKDLYIEDGNRKVLYGYFPSLSDRKVSTEEKCIELPEYTLAEAMDIDIASFDDFFKEIEKHNEDVLPDSFTYQSILQKRKSEKKLNIINECFRILTGKELIIEKQRTFIKDHSGKTEPLSDALSILSPGELILFYMSIFLAMQQNGNKNKAIILDEPESHLHPSALISFVNLLTQTNDFAEIWIATHSLFIVPEYHFDNIVYLSNSVIQKKTSTIYQSIFKELLGDEKGKVKTFFSSLSQWQYCEFIAECFTNPSVIDTVNPYDEQVQLFIRYLKKYTPLRVLDCGGGSGRLGLSVEAAQIGQAGKIDYDIFDIKPSYDGDKFDVYTDIKMINGYYHCVVMMNFLHEVEPERWQYIFYDLYSLMEKNAYLIFVEVASLTKGEMPNPQGYFVLSKEELEILFNCPNCLTEIRHSVKQKSFCYLIPKKSLLHVNQGTIYKAIIHLQDRTLNEIKQLRIPNNTDEERRESNARHYAFLSQQYINAKLFIDSKKHYEANLMKIKEAGNAFGVLHVTIGLIERQLPNIGDDLLDKMFIEFQNTIKYLQNNGTITSDLLTKCWKYIPLIEKNRYPKQIIALFLLVLDLMGDARAKKRLKNNGYFVFLPEF